MIWNPEYVCLFNDDTTIVFTDGKSVKNYSKPLQLKIFGSLRSTPNLSLGDFLNFVDKDSSLQQILTTVNELIWDGLILTEDLPNQNSSDSKESEELISYHNITFVSAQGELTLIVTYDVFSIDEDSLQSLSTNQFVFIWVFNDRFCLSPFFDKTELYRYYLFKSRVRHIFFFRQLKSNYSDFKVSKSLFQKCLEPILSYLPTFISTGESMDTIVIFHTDSSDIEKLKIIGSQKDFITVTKRLKKTKSISEVYKLLEFHSSKTFGFDDKIESWKSPFGGWVASGGMVFRSNRINLETALSMVRSRGNGACESDAIARALFEFLERYSQIFRSGIDKFIFDSYNNLIDKAIHPSQLQNFSSTQYFKDKVKSHEGKTLVPFDENSKIAWSPIYESQSGREKYIPTSLLFMGGPEEDYKSEFYFTWATNGTAAGSSAEMAKLNALYELIERDSYAIWWYNKLECPQIEFESLYHVELIRKCLAVHERENKGIYFFNITHDTQIPTVAVVSLFLDNRPMVACGADQNWELACEKAIRELNQLYFYYKKSAKRLKPEEVKEINELLRVNNKIGKSEMPQPKRFSLASELGFVQEQINKAGLTIYYKELTRRDAILPVYKAIIPEMRNSQPQFANGRLYEVADKLYGIKNTEADLRSFSVV